MSLLEMCSDMMDSQWPSQVPQSTVVARQHVLFLRTRCPLLAKEREQEPFRYTRLMYNAQVLDDAILPHKCTVSLRLLAARLPPVTLA